MLWKLNLNLRYIFETEKLNKEFESPGLAGAFIILTDFSHLGIVPDF